MSKQQYSKRPIIIGTGYVEPTLAEWAHLVVEPLESHHGKIFLGPQQAAGKSKLAALNAASPPVGAIVNCTNSFPNHHEDDSIAYCVIAINDEFGANILVYLDGAVRFMRHHILQGRSVLVHCAMGVSRSATVVIAYLMQYRAMTKIEAYTHVKERRPQCNPNPGFWTQLDIFGERIERDNNVDKSGLQNERRNNTTFDKDWAEKSLATYQTIGHIIEDPAEMFRDITNTSCSNGEVIRLAVDFVFGRGVLETDLDWLSALFGAHSSIGVNPKLFVDGMFTEGSEFMDMWVGEVYPERVEKIMGACKDE
jgi:protein-tyrosine phosphatase